MKSVGWDLETNGLDPYFHKILSIQLGNEHKQYVYHINGILDLEPIFELLEDPKLAKVGHNLKFDYKMIKHHFDVNPVNLYDTFILENLLTKGMPPSFKRNLGIVMKRYLPDVPELDKKHGKHFTKYMPATKFTKEDQDYAALDVAVMIPLLREVWAAINKDGLNVTAKMEQECLMAIGDIELNGVELNVGEWKKLMDMAEIEKSKELDKLNRYYGPIYDSLTTDEKDNLIPGKNSNKNQAALDLFGEYSITEGMSFDSPLQIKGLLEKDLGISLAGTDQKIIGKFEKSNSGIKHLIAYRAQTKRITTYGQNVIEFINSITGRIHCKYNQSGTDTGRISANDPNMQNQPALEFPDYRRPWQVPAGYKMICADYSGMELRILAELSEEWLWIDSFKKGYEMHTFVASLLFNIDYSSMIVDVNAARHKCKPEFKTFRSNSKTINFGVAYGKTYHNLMKDLEISKHEAIDLLDSFWGTFSKIKGYLDKMIALAEEKDYAYSPLDNRRRWFTSDPHTWDSFWKKNHAQNIARNIGCQGAGASIMKRALVSMRKSFLAHPEWEAKLLFTVHDEVGVEVKEEYAEVCAVAVEKDMIDASDFYLKLTPMVVDLSIGDYWIH